MEREWISGKRVQGVSFHGRIDVALIALCFGMAPIRLRLRLVGRAAAAGTSSAAAGRAPIWFSKPISKFSQAQPSKIKQKSLDFLDFIRPNWDFSMGYGDSKQEYKKAIFSFLGLSRPIKIIDIAALYNASCPPSPRSFRQDSRW
jgi:hypothetical protein